MQNVDDGFYERADAHIHLSNSQITKEIGSGKVSASLMYSAARFNSWVSACSWCSGNEMADAKDEEIEYFVSEYREILEENMDDYISNFEKYMQPNESKAEATSWKREPFIDGVSIPFDLEIHKRQIEQISKGLIPQDMEDKWFIYYEKPYLYIHRSWTGQPVYRVEFEESGAGYYVKEALFSSHLINSENEDLEGQGKLAYFLVCNFLLGQSVPYPRHSGVDEPLPDVCRHKVSDNAHQDETTKPKKKWWNKW